MAGDFGKSLWSRLILQACEEDAALRHGVIALGALDKTCDAMGVTSFTSDYRPDRLAGDAHHTFALQQYGKSVKQMRESVASGQLDMRTTLIGCLIAVCFESFHGNTQAAISQARSGVQLLNDWLPNFSARGALLRSMPSSPKIPVEIDDELILAFNRLDVESVSFMFAPPVPLTPSALHDSISALMTMPDRFNTLDSARLCMEQLMRTSIHWCIYNSVHTDDEDVPVWDTTAETPELMTLIWTHYHRTVRDWSQFVRMHNHWYAAASPLFERARTPAGQKELSAAIAIELRFRTCIVAFSNIRGETDEQDPGLEDPRETLNLAESLSARRKAHKLEHNSAFTFDGPIIGALHVVTQKSSDPMLRRRAIALLESRPRREGPWDSLMIAKLATLSLRIEEGGKLFSSDGSPITSEPGTRAGSSSGSVAGSPPPGLTVLGRDIPEHARIQASRTTFDLQRKSGTLHYRTRRPIPGIGYRYGRVDFKW